MVISIHREPWDNIKMVKMTIRVFLLDMKQRIFRDLNDSLINYINESLRAPDFSILSL